MDPAKVATSPNATRMDSCISPWGAISAPTYRSAIPAKASPAATMSWS